MRSPSPPVVILSATLILFSLIPATFAAFPSFVTRAVDAAGSTDGALENSCQCDCCYSVGGKGRTECVPPLDTTFDVETCKSCDVDACTTVFSVACGQQSSTVNADCIVREGWVLKLVPMVFIGASLVLLVYGVFFKKYDGYHQAEDDEEEERAPLLEDVGHRKLPSFSAGGSFDGLDSSFGGPYDGLNASLGASERNAERQPLPGGNSSRLEPILEVDEAAPLPHETEVAGSGYESGDDAVSDDADGVVH